MYAIDFGTSNTVVTRWQPLKNQPEVLSLAGLSWQDSPNPSLIPSLVYAKSLDTVYCGQQVRDQGLDIPGDPRFFRNFKRGIGATVQGFLPEIDSQRITFEQVGTWFLERLWQQMVAQGESLTDLVLTVPVNSFEQYRQWLGTQVADWPCQRVQLLDEPTAAALGYQVTENQPILVFDFGGGTLDLSLIEPGKTTGLLLKWGDQLLKRRESRPRTAKVLAKVGRNLGGSDIDLWLAQALAQQFQIPRSYRLQKIAERIKIRLSSQESHQEPYLDEETFSTYELSCTRQQLQQLLAEQGFFAQLDGALQELTQQARQQGYVLGEVPRVLVVGGTSQLPAVRDWLTQKFSPRQLAWDKPFTAVAEGALYLGQSYEVKDYLYHGYGLRYWDHRQAQHNWQPIFPQGTPYPTQPYELVLGASVSNQLRIELIIGELGQTKDVTEVYFDGQSLVTRQGNSINAAVRPLNLEAQTLAPLEPPGAPGLDRVRIRLWVDAQRTLRVTVFDLLTKQTLTENQAVIDLR